jgi:hypothetical protein
MMIARRGAKRQAIHIALPLTDLVTAKIKQFAEQCHQANHHDNFRKPSPRYASPPPAESPTKNNPLNDPVSKQLTSPPLNSGSQVPIRTARITLKTQDGT